MQFHKIEIDSEVLNHLKEHAEPFEDSPNSVLRKLLLDAPRDVTKQASDMTTFSPKTDLTLPDWPSGIPKALQHTLEMIYLVKKLRKRRTDATHILAERHRVDYQTIIDKYCRQLGLQAYEMDRLLRNGSLPELESVLASKFQYHKDLIEGFFSDLN